jgi:methylphosphotriester-DNA--protein-cysteine methyltransferase
VLHAFRWPVKGNSSVFVYGVDDASIIAGGIVALLRLCKSSSTSDEMERRCRRSTRLLRVLYEGAPAAVPKQLAASQGISRRTLDRCFLKDGIPTPASLLREARRARALELVRDGRISAEEVAHASGWMSARTVRRLSGEKRHVSLEIDDGGLVE